MSSTLHTSLACIQYFCNECTHSSWETHVMNTHIHPLDAHVWNPMNTHVHSIFLRWMHTFFLRDICHEYIHSSSRRTCMESPWMNTKSSRMQESCHAYEWVTSHIWMSHVSRMQESCHTYEWVLSRSLSLHLASRSRSARKNGVIPTCIQSPVLFFSQSLLLNVCTSLAPSLSLSPFHSGLLLLSLLALLFSWIPSHTHSHAFFSFFASLSHYHKHAPTAIRTHSQKHTKTHTYTHIHKITHWRRGTHTRK